MNDYDRTHHRPPAPVAKVSLRHMETRQRISDVLLLIDTGADLTLLPRSALTRLGAAAIPDVVYEVQTFDGTHHEAPVVSIDLLFLRRWFRGRYLIVDHDVGILGRDILNHHALLLDGPRQRWLEVRQ